MAPIMHRLSEEYEGIYFIEGKQKGRVPYSNALLVGDYLIDTGVSKSHLRRVKKRFPIKHLLFSHWHDDHIHGASYLIDDEVDVLCHPQSKPIMENIIQILDLYEIKNTPVEPLFRNFVFNAFDVQNINPTGTFEGGDLFKIADSFELEVIYSPGHCIGNCCFFEHTTKTAFMVDIDLSRYGPWYGDQTSNVLEFEQSLDRLLQMDIEIAVTGHSGVFHGSSLIKEKLRGYKDIIYQRDDTILSLLSESKPLNPHNLIEKNIIYKNYSNIKEFLLIQERIMIRKHFDKFLQNGIIEKVNSGYILS